MEVQGAIAACGHGAIGGCRGPGCHRPGSGRRAGDDGSVGHRVRSGGGLGRGRRWPDRAGDDQGCAVVVCRNRLRGERLGVGCRHYDLAYGGNHCIITDLASLELPFDRDRAKEILHAGLDLVAASRTTLRHLDGSPSTLRHAQLLAPGASSAKSQHAMVIAPGWFDRSPCGTGTAARMAQLHAPGRVGNRRRVRQRVLHR